MIKVFDMTAATTGLNEKRAKKLGIDTDKVILSPMSHARLLSWWKSHDNEGTF